ncbi:GAF and ANTAR domain-containing protein [Citricoccus sp. K5]|uniref:GAF and ANTAR domain-containing protein n=1 Tax=Citricoccus sp. K5 TaxID=2653135 RepID=UPI0012F09623|nr:GAF and ANTAR domain-containing protein [Citricoccus sp. K5]VXA96775.1 ANTAR domain-containing protein [Citricoccus sp. K5]
MTETEQGTTSEWLYDLLLDSPDLQAFLEDFTAALHHGLTTNPGVLWCSVTVLRKKRAATMASSAGWIHELDVRQYELGDGPCLTAAAELVPQYVPDCATDEQWPAFTTLAAEAGVKSILAFPFDLAGEASGCFNIYFSDHQSYDDLSRHELESILGISSKGLRLAVRLAAHEETQADLDAALRSRTSIDLAVGIIMGQNRCSQDEAFKILTEVSSHRNIKVRELATSLVDKVSQAPTETHFDR